jgi:hypothetical protein
LNDLNLPQPDFSRWPASAGQIWRTITSSKAIERIVELNLTPEQDAQLAGQLGAHTTAGKCAAIIAAAALDDSQDDALAVLLPDFIAAARHVAAACRAAGQP